jgi:hypothetical protein
MHVLNLFFQFFFQFFFSIFFQFFFKLYVVHRGCPGDFFLPASRDAGNRIAHGTTILLAFVKDKEI